MRVCDLRAQAYRADDSISEMSSHSRAKVKVPISMRALVGRINRKLEPDRQQLKITRAGRTRSELGAFYLLNFSGLSVIKDHVDPVALGRKLGVLQEWEDVVE